MLHVTKSMARMCTDKVLIRVFIDRLAPWHLHEQCLTLALRILDDPCSRSIYARLTAFLNAYCILLAMPLEVCSHVFAVSC